MESGSDLDIDEVFDWGYACKHYYLSTITSSEAEGLFTSNNLHIFGQTLKQWNTWPVSAYLFNVN